MRFVVLLSLVAFAMGQMTTDSLPETSSASESPSSSSTLETTTDDKVAATTTTMSSTSPTTTSSTTTTTTEPPQTSTEWQDMDDLESQKLVNFVVSEIQKLKMEHKELDDCQELNLSSVLSGKKLVGKSTKYSITLKVQPQIKNREECLKQNSTMTNMHPEICEADVTEGDIITGREGKTLLRSTCLQVEELQD
ncbi:uncharacterized protein [Parasteatoda tepidariorum]|nr:uncharacterized protein LOC107440234 [Parasteatoda tepidariorum]